MITIMKKMNTSVSPATSPTLPTTLLNTPSNTPPTIPVTLPTTLQMNGRQVLVTYQGPEMYNLAENP